MFTWFQVVLSLPTLLQVHLFPSLYVYPVTVILTVTSNELIPTVNLGQSTLDVEIRSLFIKSYHKAERVFTREKFWALHFLKRQSLPPSQCLCKKIYQFSRVMFNLKHKYLTLPLYKYRKKKKAGLPFMYSEFRYVIAAQLTSEDFACTAIFHNWSIPHN